MIYVYTVNRWKWNLLQHASLRVTLFSELGKNDHLPCRPRASNIKRLNEDHKSVSVQRTGHWLPKKGWLKPRYPLLKKPKPQFFHPYFQSSLLTSPPSSAVSSEMPGHWSCAVEEWQQNWGWPIQSQCGENLTTYQYDMPTPRPFFSRHNKAAPLLLVQCSCSTFLFVSSLPFLRLDLNSPATVILCSFPSQNLDEKRI